MISNNLETISDYAFDGCEGLEVLVARNVYPWSFNENVFPDMIYKTVPVYVPKGSKLAYEKVNSWNKFWNMYEYDEDDIIISVDVVDASQKLLLPQKVVRDGSIIIRKGDKEYNAAETCH